MALRPPPRVSTPIVVLGTSLLLFGGLQVLALVVPTADHPDKLQALSQVSVGLFIAIGIPVGILEGLFWTVAFVELGARFASSPWLGAMAGMLAFGVAFHWTGGVDAVLYSSWIVLVINASYVILRRRSRAVAILSTLGQKLAFILFAAITIYPLAA